MELHTPRLLLRELELADAELANRYERDPEVVRYMSNGVLTLEESRASIRRTQEPPAPGPRQVFDLAVTREGVFIGRAGVGIKDAPSGQGMLWWVIAPGAQRQGYATEAAAALLGFGFATLGLHRIYVDIDPRNTSSRRLAEKLGMRQEAHLRENVFLKGEWVDSVILAILQRDWRA
jgi:ribosomal-protein-alanine N-acetyltransferase